MCFYTLVSAGSAVNPVMHLLITAFPDVDPATVRMISTLPPMVGLVFGFLFGALLGKRLKWKTTLIIGLVLMTVGGLGPIWFNSSFAVILVFRIILGMGLGTIQCRDAFTIRYSSESAKTRWLGIGMFAAGIGGLAFSLLSGVLGEFGWQAAFYLYALCVAVLIIVIVFMKEPDQAPGAAGVETRDNNAPEEKRKVGFAPIIYLVLCFLSMLVVFPVMTGVATLIDYRDMGSSTIAGLVIACYSLSGILTGLAFNRLFKSLGRFMQAFSWTCIAIGLALVLFSTLVPLMGLGAFLLGVGALSVGPTLSFFMSHVAPKGQVSLFITLLALSNLLGIFLSSYWIVLCNTALADIMALDVERALLASLVLVIAIAVVMCIVDPRPKTLKARSAAEAKESSDS
jgi:MFS family permease